MVSAPAGSGLDEGIAVYISGMEAGPRSYGGQKIWQTVENFFRKLRRHTMVILAGEYQRWGGMASYSVAPVRAVSAIPEPLDMAQAATLNGRNIHM